MIKYIAFFIFLIPLAVSAQDGYYFLFLNTNPTRAELSKKETDSLQEGHMANMARMANEGKLVVAGPFEGGGGIFILKTGDFREAQSWILTDPAIQAGRYRLELLPFEARTGTPCLASEDSPMAKFNFIRYEPYLTKFNIQKSPVLFQDHDDYLEKVKAAHDVVSEGIFTPNDGGILILRGAPDKELIMQDPAVKEGMLQPVFKELWLAEGSFCHTTDE
jgi:uncharacterized protein YciI